MNGEKNNFVNHYPLKMRTQFRKHSLTNTINDLLSQRAYDYQKNKHSKLYENLKLNRLKKGRKGNNVSLFQNTPKYKGHSINIEFSPNNNSLFNKSMDIKRKPRELINIRRKERIKSLFSNPNTTSIISPSSSIQDINIIENQDIKKSPKKIVVKTSTKIFDGIQYRIEIAFYKEYFKIED